MRGKIGLLPAYLYETMNFVHDVAYTYLNPLMFIYVQKEK